MCFWLFKLFSIALTIALTIAFYLTFISPGLFTKDQGSVHPAHLPQMRTSDNTKSQPECLDGGSKVHWDEGYNSEIV